MSGKKGMKKYPAGMQEKVLTELKEQYNYTQKESMGKVLIKC